MDNTIHPKSGASDAYAPKPVDKQGFSRELESGKLSTGTATKKVFEKIVPNDVNYVQSERPKKPLPKRVTKGPGKLKGLNNTAQAGGRTLHGGRGNQRSSLPAQNPRQNPRPPKR